MKTFNETETLGLYRSEYEHDACGIGFYADIKGRPSHDIVVTGLEMLRRLEHRAGKDAEGETGDGAGVLLQIPHRYFQSVCTFSLPEKGQYAVGMLFLPKQASLRTQILEDMKLEIQKIDLPFIGVRDVPVRPETIGSLAKAAQPHICQVFIGNHNHCNEDDFERKLYVIRKRLERKYRSDMYIASLSSQTVVYKGMLKAEQIQMFYPDLKDERFASALALIHSRFSTNTFPSWERAHPNRLIAHNGEINTVRGNINWFNAKAKGFSTSKFGVSNEDLMPIIDPDGSDSASFDNALEFLTLSGRSLPHAVAMMVPEPWEDDSDMPIYLKNFYEYHSRIMEAWDGPMALGFTNGRQIGAVLDRNGLRPGRYYVTHDDRLMFSSEVGVIDIEDSQVKERCHLKPGELLLVDTEQGRLIPNDELKLLLSMQKPYADYLQESVISPDLCQRPSADLPKEPNELLRQQKINGYTYEEVMKVIKPMAEEAKESTGSMGVDTPLAVLSERPQLLFNYFKQWFSQVTNPPIDAIREACVISTKTWLGTQEDLIQEDGQRTMQIQLDHPLLDPELFHFVQNQGLKTATINIGFDINEGEARLEKATEGLFSEADQAISEGASILILSDQHLAEGRLPMPSLLAVAGLHHHLVRQGTRTQVSIIVDSGEPRDSHHMAMLIGYGADAIHPYLAFETIERLVLDQHVDLPIKEAVSHYITALNAGVVKVMSKVGISTIQSYRGAQAFEAVGLSEQLLERYFTGTVSQISGIGLEEVAKESMIRWQKAAEDERSHDITLEAGSDLQWRKEGEHHQVNPKVIHTLQQAARKNDKELYKKFVNMAEEGPFSTVRSLLDIKSGRKAISIDDVEPVEKIFQKFKTGAMSYGALSSEAHEALAIAMNRIGGKSNSGEGGEDVDRFIKDENGDDRRSAIKQVASGRFGVTSHYLTEADEIQIKMAQGAKPGEGGQLPSKKVYPWIAEVRGSTPGVGLISPPPHHDIYSIEDLAQLIYDLKCANPKARISVKLVAKAGVGTIAAGVAKGLADVILISGHDGGTGAAAKTSIKHAGLPWELGLAEAHQTLKLNGLRERVVLEADGKLMTGKDVIIAACLGAEEYGFSTAPLVVLGCLIMRACHLDTCPVGIATQNPELRKKFMGSPDHIVNYMTFIAEEIREILAECGYRSLDDIVGETNVLKLRDRVADHWKTRHLNLSNLLFKPEDANREKEEQNHELDARFDYRHLIPACQPYIKKSEQAAFKFSIGNSDRAVGTSLGHFITKVHGAEGLPVDTLQLSFQGAAGQSFGAFVPKGLTMSLEGDANDYVGKGLSGGKLIVKPGKDWMDHEHQAIIGNVAFYGGTAGESYIRGRAGQRFCVRNSGVNAVVEGVGDHGCEYMTGGRVVILGEVGKNFAAGMSGGIAYIYSDQHLTGQLLPLINRELVTPQVLDNEDEAADLYHMIRNHFTHTGSPKAKKILGNWKNAVADFVKIIPREYEAMQETIKKLEMSGMSEKEAQMTAFQLKKEGKSVEAHDDASYQTV
ncbi:glutamate synthase (NADPH) large subunit [Scopulibacillus darangshiensis]|uniref:Glutamate synthase (NADPH) large subunit n=1 Tax=Scopulibacillus darangshiensis TaxID=442528 RepID=A0A4V2SL38_9BACL|nr:glutamate synthase large subunit [Scopulibacillus darangshiensis]TCP21926.1 glutamate synthase (NADPH) large subunit [Scopulibacillus darangshiensis]